MGRGGGALRAVSRVSNEEGVSRVLSSASSSSPPASVNAVSFCWAAGGGQAQVRNRKAGRGERAATGGVTLPHSVASANSRPLWRRSRSPGPRAP